MRVATSQPRSRLIDYHLKPEEVLRQVDGSLDELIDLVHRAGDDQCEVLAFPEDTLGVLHWEAGNKASVQDVLPAAVDRMLLRLGQAAASHGMYLICSSDAVDDGSIYNTAFFLGRDGTEIGRYRKVNLAIHESDRSHGDHFPVFETPDLGGVGMLICYDMVFPEAARCLALGGADIIFHPTLGGAALGDGDISLAAFRTRAVENFVYIVVSQRGSGSMILSPQGDVICTADGPDAIAIADLDPFGGREAQDAANRQDDMRARLFRERWPSAFGILTDPHPPVLDKIPATLTVDDAVRIGAGVLTTGADRFTAAEEMLAGGHTEEAAAIFRQLISEFPESWIDRVSRQRLADLDSTRPRGRE